MATKIKKSGGTVYQTGRKKNKIDTKDGTYTTTSAVEVETKDGNRWYEGKGRSKRLNISRRKAQLKALAKVHGDPADSLVTGGKVPDYTAKPKKKKRFWQK